MAITADRPDAVSPLGRARAELRGSIEQLAADIATAPDQALRDEVRRECRALLSVLDGQPGAGKPPPALTPHQLEVLRLTAAGYSDAGIAEQLGAAVGSVQSAMRSLRRSFEVRSRHAAVSAARATGLLP